MPGTPEEKSTPPFPALAARHRLWLRWLHGHGWLMLALERLCAHSWRMTVWCLAFASLWIFALPQSQGDAVAVAVFVIFIIGLCYFFHVDMRRLRWPRMVDVERRIEQGSGVTHHPLMTMGDHLANPHTDTSHVLWDEARTKAFSEIYKLKAITMNTGISRKDRFALRYGLLLVLGVGVFLAGSEWRLRLWSGIAPFSFSWGASTLQPVRLLITPPPYTGLPQINVTGPRDEGLNIPAGSVIKALVHSPLGFMSAPRMEIGPRHYFFSPAAGKDYGLEIMAPPGGPELRITQMFLPKGEWTYKYIVDQPPVITLTDAPDILPEGSLRFPVRLSDDYGVVRLTLTMTLKDKLNAPPIGRPVRESRPVSSPRGKEVDISEVFDLSAHPWAGRTVLITLQAEDALHQSTRTNSVEITLPERVFTHPLAREIIALRSRLLADPVKDYESLQESLENMIAQPDQYRRDIVTLLALRSASSRLFWAGPSLETAESVAALLWDTALRIEDGNFSFAKRDLRDAHKALSEALQNPEASDAEIAQLMDQLRMAMARYLTELQAQIARRMAQQGQQAMMLSPEMFSNLLSPEQLASMLSAMENQILSGDRSGAQKMLSQMQRMMDSLNPQGQEIPQAMQEMMKAGQQLQDVIARQQKLLDQVMAYLNAVPKSDEQAGTRGFGEIMPMDLDKLKEWNLDNMPPQPVRPALSSDMKHDESKQGQNWSSEQEAIRLLLGDVMIAAGSAMGKIPEGFTKAEQEMRLSINAINAIDYPASRLHQENVLRHLQDAKQSMAEQLMKQMQNMMGMAMGGGMRLDPLGRPMRPDGEGMPGAGSVTIPDEAQRKEAQEIMRLLQERAGQFHRPAPELDYYRRLLRQF